MIRHLPERGEVASAPGDGCARRRMRRRNQQQASASPASAEVIAQHMGLAKALGFAACTSATDPNSLLGRCGGYTGKVTWGTERTVEVFPGRADAVARQESIELFRCPFGSGSLDLPGQCAAAAGLLGYVSAGSARRGRVPGGLEGRR